MTEELTIRININGRVYPLTIERKEEGNYREAAKMVNDIVQEYLKKYTNLDMQDALSMTAFQYVLQNRRLKERADESPLMEELKLLDEELSDYLSLSE